MPMKRTFRLYIPTECRCGEMIDSDLRQKWFSDARAKMVCLFGGTTEILPGQWTGAWQTDDGRIATEPIDVIESHAGDDVKKATVSEFKAYASKIADELSQWCVSYEIDGWLYFADPTSEVCPHESLPGHAQRLAAQEKVMKRRQKRHFIDNRLRKATTRKGLQDLAIEGLGYREPVGSKLPPAGNRPLEELTCAAPEILGQREGFELVHIQCRPGKNSAADRKSVVSHYWPKGSPSRLLIFSEERNGTLAFVRATEETGRDDKRHLVLRHFVVNTSSPSRFAIDQLAQIALAEDSLCSCEQITETHRKAFDVEALGDRFFNEYEKVFNEVRESLVGFRGARAEERHVFTQQLLNRLMVVKFLEGKSWLLFDGSTDYLEALWRSHTRSEASGRSFYRLKLRPLFFAGLNVPVENRTSDASEIGDVPYLNGGLFTETEWDRSEAVDVPDVAIERILGLFGRFAFSVSENSALDVEAAVDPQMLGRMFERMVTNREAKGAYYTPMPIVSYMCREALKSFLATSLPDERPEALEALVDRNNQLQINNPGAVVAQLDRCTVCDPACGSGAYLLGMLDELLRLGDCLLVSGTARSRYERKLSIIQRNLYGVDIDPSAVQIARLRLWLSLLTEYEGPEPLPLPNLDFKIEQGDSLIAPDPNPGGVRQLDFRSAAVSSFRDAKRRYLKASGDEKEQLLHTILESKKSIAEWAHPEAEVAGFDWAVEFAEVLAEGGFDIVITNPPYVRGERVHEQNPNLRAIYDNRYPGNADLYVYFYHRGLDLLKPGGTLLYISSNKWLRESYGARLRAHISETCEIVSIVDFGEQPVFKGVATFPMIFAARRLASGQAKGSFRLTQVKSLELPYPDVRKLVEESGTELPATAYDGEEWRLVPPPTADKVRKMQAAAKPLKDYVNARIYRGIVTGCNKVFYIDEATKREITADGDGHPQVIKPVLIGKDVKRWQIADSRRSVVFTKRGIDVNAYPTILSYLSEHRKRLEPEPKGWQGRGEWPGRKPGTYQWYEIQDEVNYHPVFAEPKIIYPDISQGPKFTFDAEGRYLDNTLTCIPVNDLYLLGVLNSSHMWTLIKATFPFLGDPEDAGRARLKTVYMERLPIPDASPEEQAAIAELAQKCIDARGVGCEEWEAEINERVAALYGL